MRWEWINGLLLALAPALGCACELAWSLLPVAAEPPMIRFIAAELAKDHWFDISAARCDLGYSPKVGMREGTAALVDSLRHSSVR